MRRTCSTGVIHTLPSPILPVRATSTRRLVTRSTSSSSTTMSMRVLGTKSMVYSAPRYTSVWPRWRPKPWTSLTVSPCTPSSLSASFTSSSLKGLMMPVMSFTYLRSPFSGRGRRSDPLERVADLRMQREVEPGLLVLLGHTESAGQHALQHEADHERDHEGVRERGDDGQRLFPE